MRIERKWEEWKNETQMPLLILYYVRMAHNVFKFELEICLCCAKSITQKQKHGKTKTKHSS